MLPFGATNSLEDSISFHPSERSLSKMIDNNLLCNEMGNLSVADDKSSDQKFSPSSFHSLNGSWV
jgi:hypothetical protein